MYRQGYAKSGRTSDRAGLRAWSTVPIIEAGEIALNPCLYRDEDHDSKGGEGGGFVSAFPLGFLFPLR
jgi:hypothetical protein